MVFNDTALRTEIASSDPPRLSVLAPTRYPWRFNSPRSSAHNIRVRGFVPFNKIHPAIEGVTLFNPFPPRRFDLIHAFNRIPLVGGPFIVGFESHLPRAFGLEGSRYFRALTGLLTGERCRKIIAISRFAANIFCATHAHNPAFDDLKAKLCLRYPNMPVPAGKDAMADAGSATLVVTFVGNHFARKGGCVAVKVAQKALTIGFPLDVRVVSRLEVGGAIWTDPADLAFFEPYLRLLRLPNVTHHSALPNGEVLQLLRTSHFSILTTFCDTFGYSAIESMMNHTPVIATRQGALPEFIRDNENGILLDLPVNELGEWRQDAYGPRDGTRFKRNFADEIERLAEEALGRLIALCAEDGAIARMRKAARKEAVDKFDAASAQAFWDDLYREACRKTPR